MKILVTAVPGAGKTTILKYVKRKMPKVKVVNVGDLMFDIAKKRFGIKNRDEMRKKLSIENHRFAQRKAYEKIAKMKNKIILIDTHLSVKTPMGFFPGISDDLAKLAKIDIIIVLEFNPKDVIERRKKDLPRKKFESVETGVIRIPRQRDIETEKEIELHQEFNRQIAFIVGNVADAAVKIISLRTPQKKPFEHAKIAANKIIEIIKAAMEKSS